MRSTALPSSQYGDPCRVLEEKQAREANAKKRNGQRRILTTKPGWSKARQAAENLFAPEPVLASVQGTPSNSGQAGKTGKDLQQ